MKMSDGVEWGIHCCTLLAALPEGTAMHAAALAEFHGVSESYLLKHLKALAKAGVLESLPGPKGGYRLARRPAAIALLDIVEAVEGSEPAFRCTEIRQRGPGAIEASAYRRPCPINAAMLRADTAWRSALREQTLDQLVTAVDRQASARSRRQSLEWLGSNIRR